MQQSADEIWFDQEMHILILNHTHQIHIMIYFYSLNDCTSSFYNLPGDSSIRLLESLFKLVCPQ